MIVLLQDISFAIDITLEIVVIITYEQLKWK